MDLILGEITKNSINNFENLLMSTSDKNIFIYQIFYDENSKNKIDPDFIGLDNLENLRPDWYEFLPIKNFLLSNDLKEDAWYGFLSPNFTAKTGFSGIDVINTIKEHQDNYDVALFSHGYDQLAYFKNPFFQGEIWHPGLIQLSQKFIDSIGLGIEIENLVTYSVTSTFSNYIVAKPKFWREWLSLAIQFYNYVELGNDGLDKMMTSYGSNEYLTSMKTFIQERLSCLILSQLNYRILAVRKNIPYPVFNRLFEVEPDTAQILKTLDLLKEKYIQSKDIDYLNMFYRVREAVKVIPQNQ